MKQLPILLYQNIGTYPDKMMEDGLLPETFERQMRYLSENGNTIVSLAQALQHMHGQIDLSQSSLSITIDGGYQDAFTNAYPILKKYQFPATFFITPEFVGKQRFINGEPIECLKWGMLKELINNGMDIGLLANKGMGIISFYDEEEIKNRISNSVQMFKEKMRQGLRYCAFREGIPKKPLWEFIQNHGIEAVFTQSPTNCKLSVEAIGRIQIDDDDHNIFLTKISKPYLFFKDKRSWQYIRRYKMDRVAHRVSETLNWIKGDDNSGRL